MSRTLNFNNMKKQYLTVTLADEDSTVLMIGTPTKAIINDLIALQTGLEDLEKDSNNAEAINDLYTACASVMSRNKAGKKITTEFLEDLFDLEDIIIFLKAYMDFVGEIANSKN